MTASLLVCTTKETLRVHGPDPKDQNILRQKILAPNNSPGQRQVLASPGRRKAGFADPASETDRAARVAEADELGRQGESLAAEWTETSLRKAIATFAAARAVWQALGDAQNEARALNAIAEIHVNLGEYQNAMRIYNEELTLSRTPTDVARSLNGISSVHTYLGNERKALFYCTKAFKLSQAAGDHQGQAESLLNAGENYYFLGQHEKAIKKFELALSVWPNPAWRNRALALVNLGYAHFDLREIDKASAYYEQSLTLARAEGNRRSEALALTAIGGVHSYLGNKQIALKYHSDAVTLFRTIGDRNGEAVALNGLGYAYRNLADFQKSLDCYLRALELFQLLGNREYENFTLTRVGKSYEGLGDTAKALEYYELAYQRAANYPQTRVNALNSIGTVLESIGQPQKALLYYNRALALFRAVGDKMGEASTLNSIGTVFASFGRSEAAQKEFYRALEISRAVRDRRGETLVLFNIAQNLSKSGKYDKARQLIETSLRVVESLRDEVANPALRASYFASVRRHYELYVDVTMRSHQLKPDRRLVEEAFALSEKARARSLLEILAEAHTDIRQGIDPALKEQEHLLQKKLSEAAERHQALIAGNKIEEGAKLAKEIDHLTIQSDQLQDEIRSKNPRYAALTQPQPLSLKEIQQQLLDDDSLLLEYMLGDERSYVWVVSRTEITSYELPARAEIENKANTFYELLKAHQPVAGETFEQRQARIAEAKTQLAAASDSLSNLVIGPVIGKLGTKRLIIVPDGALQYIPFQALSVPEVISDQVQIYDDSSRRIPLLVNHEIVYEPSASALALVLADSAHRKTAPNSVAVFANPVFEADDPRVKPTGVVPSQTPYSYKAELQDAFRNFRFGTERIPTLPASLEEADSIISVAPWGTGLKAIGFEASRATVTHPDLANYRIIHFATHGFVDYQRPELSGLVLSLVDENGRPQDGFLRLHDIYNLKLTANLVVLSACNTGLGKEIKGEGLIGLTRGFMYAGATGVAASLWKVDDEATAELMKGFYEGMFRKGLTSAAAMRESQLEMRRTKRWDSPFYWAAFVIQGQYDQKEQVVSSRTPPLGWTAVWCGLSSFGLIAVFHLMRRRRSRVL